jgi:chromate transporter
MSVLWNLFTTFFKIGLFTFGGGYAMIPLLSAELAKKKRWTTDEELMDYYSIGQCTPGIIAVNVSTFIGFLLHG